MVVAKHEQVALVDAFGIQSAKACGQECSAYTPATRLGGDCQVMNKTAPSVVAAQDSANNGVSFACHEARTWVANEVGQDLGLFVRFTQADTRSSFPQGTCLAIVLRCERDNLKGHRVVVCLCGLTFELRG